MGKFDKPITGKKLADMLENFGIRSHKSDSRRVYRLCDFEQVFARYLTEPAKETELGGVKETVSPTNNVKLEGAAVGADF